MAKGPLGCFELLVHVTERGAAGGMGQVSWRFFSSVIRDLELGGEHSSVNR